MNPPFGAQKKGADRSFLEKAISMGNEIYMLHNPVNRRFLYREIERLGGSVISEKEYIMEIDHRFEFHRKERERMKILFLHLKGCP
jgi:putative methylase